MSARRLFGIAPAWVIAVALLTLPSPAAFLIVGGTALVSLWNPAEGLLLVAGLAPLGTLLAGQLDIPFRVTEAIVLAFLTGWLLRGRTGANGPRAPRTYVVCASLVAWLALLSVATMAMTLAKAGDLPPTARQIVWRYLWTSDRIGAGEAARLIEGLALAAAAIELVRWRPIAAERLPAALATAATIAAAFSLLLWRRWLPAEILEQYGQIDYRVAAHVSDVNAAGSYFALMTCLAAGVAMRERKRIPWIVATAAGVAGLWLAASRSAEWATIIVVPVTLGWLATRNWPARRRALTIAALGVLLLAAGAVRASLLERDPTYKGAGMRMQFNEASLRMIAERPVFGVGIGRYYPTSRLFLSPQLAWTYGVENAHDYFLQVTAETGIPGGVLLLASIGALLWSGWRGVVVAGGRDYRLLGCVAGLIAFLGTCLTGHPLLVPEVAVPFWIVLGLAAVLGASNVSRIGAVPARYSRILVVAAVAAAVAAAVSVPWRAARPRLSVPRSIAVTGLNPPQFGADGSVLQWSGEYGSVFIPAEIAAVELPLRAAPESTREGPLGVEITTGSAAKQRVLAGDYWSFPLVDLAGAPEAGGLKRIDFKVDRLTPVGGRVVGVAVQAPRPFTLR